MRTVVLCGNSLLMSAIGASLGECDDIRLLRVQAVDGETASQLIAAKPVAILYDRAATAPGFAITLLDQLPGVLVLGVNASSDRLLVVTGHEEQAVTSGDLVRVITGRGETTQRDMHGRGDSDRGYSDAGCPDAGCPDDKPPLAPPPWRLTPADGPTPAPDATSPTPPGGLR